MQTQCILTPHSQNFKDSRGKLMRWCYESYGRWRRPKQEQEREDKTFNIMMATEQGSKVQEQHFKATYVA